MFNSLLTSLESLIPLLRIVNDPKLDAQAAFLADRLSNPSSYVLLMGETSAGKSSLINGFFNQYLLPVGATPTTAMITEVEITATPQMNRFLAISKNGESKDIDVNDFYKALEAQDQNLARLKLIKTSPFSSELAGIHLFDTPGYGSIIDKHEEILKEFLPNADYILYVINFKIGFQEEDRLFLNICLELIAPNLPFAIVVNRVPQGVNESSGRVKEIVRYISDILHYTPPVFLLPNVKSEQKGVPAAPPAPALWQHIKCELASPAREKALKEAFTGYLKDLYQGCMEILERRYLESQLNARQLKEFQLAEAEYANRILEAIPQFVNPCFDQLENHIPVWLEQARIRATQAVYKVIDNADVLTKNETLTYINTHFLSFTVRQETEEIQNRIAIRLYELNQQLDDYIQREMAAFNTHIQVIFANNTTIAAQNLIKNMSLRFGLKGLEKYMGAFGGAGGANAGVANAASHALKVIGDFFGKTFSRQTHNALKHTLAKIGATSMRRVGFAITLLVEGIIFVADASTWQRILKNKTSKALDQWEKESVPLVIEELKKLREENSATLRQIANDILIQNQEDKPQDFMKAEDDLNFGRKLGKEIFNN